MDLSSPDHLVSACFQNLIQFIAGPYICGVLVDFNPHILELISEFFALIEEIGVLPSNLVQPVSPIPGRPARE